jgi:hypothetical protein
MSDRLVDRKDRIGRMLLASSPARRREEARDTPAFASREATAVSGASAFPPSGQFARLAD